MDNNDVFFSLHAVALTLVVMVQCFLYEVRDESGAHPTSGCLGQHPPPPAPHSSRFTEDVETQCLLTEMEIIELALCCVPGTPMNLSLQDPRSGVRDTERRS